MGILLHRNRDFSIAETTWPTHLQIYLMPDVVAHSLIKYQVFCDK